MLAYLNTRRLASAVLTITALALGACHDSSSRRAPVAEPTVDALFDSLASPPVLPFPHAIYRADNGRLNLPLPEDTVSGDLGDAAVALNTLDGFSTTAPISIDFAEAIDTGSIAAGDNVRLYEVAVDNSGLPSAVLSELQADEDYLVAVSAVSDSRLLLKPLIPLNASSHYLVGIGNELRAASGPRMGPSSDYASLRDGTGSGASSDIDRDYLTDLIAAQEMLLIDNGMAADTIVSSFSFPTHTVAEFLTAVAQSATAMPAELVRPSMLVGGERVPLTTEPLTPLAAFFGLTPSGQADLYTGVIDLPYYMNVPTDPADDSVRDSFIRDAAGEPLLSPDPAPQVVAVTAPLLIAVPNASVDTTIARPAQGWPVAIYHHGISGNRANMLLIADALAARGVAMVAIDQPLHGVTADDANVLPLSIFAGVGVEFYDAENERHFNLDLDGDGAIDPAGSHYSSPRNRLTLRDNLRQSVSDLLHLRATLPNIVLPDAAGPAFDPGQIHFVSLSLGSMVGTMLAGVDSTIEAFSLAAPGGSISKFSEGAPNGNEEIVAQAAGSGLEQGSEAYEDFLRLLTTIEGPGDPINYAVAAGEMHPIHVVEIIGDGTPENPPDQTIPNEVLNAGQYAGLVAETAPLAGTEPLVRAMNLEALLADAVNPDGLGVVARFLRGDHQSQINPSEALSPFALPEVTREIQNQTASFIESAGTAIEVGDSTLLEMNFLPAEP